jgi:Protein of unknown function (DUF2505)
MRFSHQVTYHASPDEVHRMLGDRAFRETVCRALNASRHEVSVNGTGAGMTVVVDQTQPARGVPSYARKVIGDEIRIVQRETWTDPSGGTLTIELPGKPGSFEGTVALADDGGGTVESVTGDVRVSVPMLGGKLEKMVGDLMRAALQTEERLGRAWLNGDR